MKLTWDLEKIKIDLTFSQDSRSLPLHCECFRLKLINTYISISLTDTIKSKRANKLIGKCLTVELAYVSLDWFTIQWKEFVHKKWYQLLKLSAELQTTHYSLGRSVSRTGSQLLLLRSSKYKGQTGEGRGKSCAAEWGKSSSGQEGDTAELLIAKQLVPFSGKIWSQ